MPPRANIRDVALLAGTSVSTVSNLLNGRPNRMRSDTVRRIEEAIERLVEILDAFDAPAEDLEPSLGSCNAEWIPQTSGLRPVDRLDLEDEHDGAEPDEEGEPSLGSLDAVTDQRQSYRQDASVWGCVDLELDATE